MTDTSPANSPSASSIPADDPDLVLTVADPDGAGVPHIFVAGGTYTDAEFELTALVGKRSFQYHAIVRLLVAD
jgi:hypothetical protein